MAGALSNHIQDTPPGLVSSVATEGSLEAGKVSTQRCWLLLGGSSSKKQCSIGNENVNNLAPVRREVRNAHAQL